MGRETKAKRKSPNDVTRGSIFTKEDIERIKSNAYRDIGKGVKDKRRSKLPPVKEVQTPSQIKDLLKRIEDRYPTPEPDMHDGGIDFGKAKPFPLFPITVQDLKFKKGGTFGSFEFKTTVDCWAVVGASRGPLHAVESSKTGYAFSSAPEYLGTDMLGPARQSHAINLINLDPDTHYN